MRVVVESLGIFSWNRMDLLNAIICRNPSSLVLNRNMPWVDLIWIKDGPQLTILLLDDGRLFEPRLRGIKRLLIWCHVVRCHDRRMALERVMDLISFGVE